MLRNVGLPTLAACGVVLTLALSAAQETTAPPIVQFTYGGNGRDVVNAVATDASGNIYIAGSTTSTDLAGLSNAFQRTRAGAGDALVAKFNSEGVLQWATLLGGNDARSVSYRGYTSPDDARAIAVDAQGNVYVAGATGSTDFPTVNAFQPGPQVLRSGSSFASVSDGFLSKIDPSGSRLLFSTYLGGMDSSSSVEGLAVNPGGEVYVAVTTRAGQFPIDRDLSADGSGLIVLGRFNPSGSRVWLTRMGYGDDTVAGLALNALGEPHLAGFSPRTPCPRGINALCPSWFVDRLSTSGSTVTLNWSLPAPAPASRGGDLAVGPDGTIAFVGGGVTPGSLQTINAWDGNAILEGNGVAAVLNRFGVPQMISYLPGAYGVRPAVAIDLEGGFHIAYDTNAMTLVTARPVLQYAPIAPLLTSLDRGLHWSWASTGLAGPLVDVALDATRNYLYAMTSGGSIQRSANNAASWESFGIAGGFGLGASGLAIDPGDPTTLYAGTGDLVRFDQDGRRRTVLRSAGAGVGGFRVGSLAVSPHDGSVWVATGNGLEVSFDRGQSWQRRDSGFGLTPVGTNYSPSAIAFNAQRPNVIYAGLPFGLYRSQDNGEHWDDLTATLTTSGYPERPSVVAVAVDPVDPDRIYAGTFNRGLIVTFDGGRTWTRPLQFAGVKTLAINPRAPHEVYAAVQIYPNAPAIMISRDRGVTWETLEPGPQTSGPAVRLLVHPADPNRLYAAQSWIGAVPYVVRRASVGTGTMPSFGSYLLTGVVRDVQATLDGKTIVAIDATTSTPAEAVVVVVGR